MDFKYLGKISLPQVLTLLKDYIDGGLRGKSDVGHSHGEATGSTLGMMSASDKAKLDGIDKGANKYSHPTYTSKANGLYKVTVDSTGHISETSSVTKADITALGVPAQDTTYSEATGSKSGLMSAADKSKLDGIADGAGDYVHPTYTPQPTGLYKLQVNELGHVCACDPVDKSDITGLGIPAQDTTYSAAGTSLGLVKSGGDVNISSGVITVKDDSHNHVISNVDGLQDALNNAEQNAVSASNSYTDDSVNALGDGFSEVIFQMYGTDLTDDGVPTIRQIASDEASKVTKSDVGLGNVDNTSDANKPVSNAQATAIADAKKAGTDAQADIDAHVENGDIHFTATERSKLAGIATGANKYTHPTYTAKNSGLYKVTVDGTGHVSDAIAVTKSDITGLGIPAQDTTYSEATTSASGLMSSSDKSKLDGIATGANKTTVDSSLSSTSTNPVQNKVINSALAGKLSTSLKGAANGLAELDANGKVPASQLPSYVDDVIEGTYVSATSFKDASGTAVTGESGKIYVDTTSGKTYRWSGSAFSVISETLALGETSSTAYRGDRGKTAYDHSQATGNPHGTSKSDLGLGNVENKSSATIRSELTKSNVTTALGYTPPTQDTTYGDATTSASGLMSASDKSKLNGIAEGANKYTHPTYTAKSSGFYKVTVDSSGHVSGTTAVTKSDITGLGIPAQDTTYSDMKGATSSAAGSAGLVPAPAAGKQASFLRGDGTWVVPTNTTYDVATQSANGLMSSTDKTKLDGIATGANKYTHPTHTAKSNGFYKVTVDSSGHVSGTTAVAKSDITALGIPAQDTTYSAATTSTAGLMSASDKSKLDGITSGANKYTHPTYTAKSSGFYKVTVDGTGHVSGTSAVAKSDITALGIPAQDTTYSAATQSASGLMSADDKKKLDGIATGANNYTYTLPTASSSTLGGVKTTSTVTSTSGLTACPIISGVPYYKDTNTSYTLSSFGLTATSTELNYMDGVTSNVQTQLNGKLDKLTYEWNKQYNAGGTAGYLLIGSFPMYDTNVTIDIDATTSTTYHGTIVIATQNVSETSIGSSHTITVYGDPTGAISNAIRVTWASGSRNYNVYFVPSTWSKNLIHIRAIGNYLENIDNSKICTQFTTGTAPSTTSGLTVTNALTSNFNKYTHPTTSGNKHIPSGGSSGQILRWSADGTAVWGAENNTTYSVATTSANGLMSAADKTKLDGLSAPTVTSSTPLTFSVTSDGILQVTY